MTKEELIERVATGAKLSKADAARALNATLNAVKGALKKGQKVTLIGFGTFSVAKRKARQGITINWIRGDNFGKVVG